MCKHDLFSIALENIMSIFVCLVPFSFYEYMLHYINLKDASNQTCFILLSSYAIFCWLSFMQLLVYQFWSEIELTDVFFKIC